MADADETKKQEDSEAAKSDKKASGGMLQWIIMAVVVIVFAGAGFALARLFAGTGTHETAEPPQQDQPTQIENLKADDSTTTNSQEGWYYELEPVVACLDEPGITRYARVTLTLKISSTLSQKQGTVLIEEKKPVLINWLSIYLASLGLDDLRGERNQRHIQLQILDAFNEKLFPNTKLQIKKILFKEFVVQ